MVRKSFVRKSRLIMLVFSTMIALFFSLVMVITRIAGIAADWTMYEFTSGRLA